MKKFILFFLIISILFPIDLRSQENIPEQNNRLNLPLGISLAVIGFGAGNYYSQNISKGITFTFIDASLTGLTIWAYTGTKINDYSLISIGVIPAVLLLFRAIEVKTVYDEIEAYNNRYIFSKPRD